MTDISITRNNDKSIITFTDPHTSQTTTVDLDTTDIYALLKKLTAHIDEDLRHFIHVLSTDDIIENAKSNLNESIFSSAEHARFAAFLLQNPEDQHKQASEHLCDAAYGGGPDINDIAAEITGTAYSELFNLDH